MQFKLWKLKINGNGLKKELKVPAVNEFGLGFVYENETVVKTTDPDLRISVYINLMQRKV